MLHKWLNRPSTDSPAAEGPAAAYQYTGQKNVTTFGTARGREQRGQLPEEPVRTS